MASEAPLAGVKVVDLTRHMAGPYATVMMADYGADVVKIESVPKGDPTRGMGLHFTEGESALFLMWNRGKRSLAIDMRDPRGLDAVRKLIAEADVFVENYRPGVADKIGLGYEELAKLNPRLIYCSVSAFGPDGPYSAYPGTDPVLQAMSGVMGVTGEADGGPVLVGVPMADFTSAMIGFQGILLALQARERSGRGQKVDVSMLHSMMHSLTTRLAGYWAGDGKDPSRFGSAHSVVVPYQAFESASGYFVAGVWADDAWPPFCRAIDREDLIEDPKFSTNVARVENREELLGMLTELSKGKSTDEWEVSFREAKALFGPVLTFSEVLSHPQVEASGMLGELEHPKLGRLPQLRSPVVLSESEGGLAPTAPPLLGADTRDVLAEIGLSADEVDALIDAGVAIADPEGAPDAVASK
jgi:crotonobetainyl-CoA:carnitine CoA-transferase CaiB-like acyl-CoA transferase